MKYLQNLDLSLLETLKFGVWGLPIMIFQPPLPKWIHKICPSAYCSFSSWINLGEQSLSICMCVFRVVVSVFPWIPFQLGDILLFCNNACHLSSVFSFFKIKRITLSQTLLWNSLKVRTVKKCFEFFGSSTEIRLYIYKYILRLLKFFHYEKHKL